jgi:hypothetical protein
LFASIALLVQLPGLEKPGISAAGKTAASKLAGCA